MSEPAEFRGAHAPSRAPIGALANRAAQRQEFRRGRRKMHARARALPKLI